MPALAFAAWHTHCATWIASIARPLVAHSKQDLETRELEHRDKQIVDDFRNADQVLAKRLDAAAEAADADARRALNNTLAFLTGSTLMLAVSAAVFGFLQARTAREALRSVLLFKHQKRIADALQAAYLNRNLPICHSICLDACYVPAAREAQVGGDWYDAFELPNGRILFSIGDVAGHGLEAAVMMGRARQAILALSLGVEDPASVLALANEALMLQDSRMVTAICGYIDIASLEVTYAAAGHPAPALALPGQPAHFLPQGGVPLGVVRNATFETHVAHAFDGALIVLYTDGVIEQTRDMIDGERRLIEAATVVAQQENPAHQIERIMLGESTPTDDVTILTVSFKRGQHDTNILTGGVGLEVNPLGGPKADRAKDSAPTCGLSDA